MSDEGNLAAIMGKNLEIKNDKFINILLLGETGVGKSTFINSMVNYLTYMDFKTAEEEDLITLIPSQCTIQDKYGQYYTIQIGSKEDQNECLEVGMSATQDVKSYIFPIQNGSKMVRLIDTPGIGDGRGIDQDNINCESILDYVGQFQELHAICYLFKPTNSRLTVYFEYCMTQLLSRLDKSASKNIIFIFTNTRGTDYSAGECFSILEKVIKGIKARPPHVDIPLKKNVFYFDNEAFRYLAAIKQNIEFSARVKRNHCESWEVSVEQCIELIEYITGNSKHSPLKPHFIQNTNAVNEARRLIAQLSQPLAEIFQLINDNLLVLQRHEEDLDINTNTIDELKKKLYMPVIDLVVTPLKQPVTVCAAKKCAKIYEVGTLNKWHYKQRCHDPCYLTNVPKEIIGCPELLDCAAICSSTGKCVACQCHFTSHLHIYYLTETVDSKIIDENVKNNISSKEKVLEDVKNYIKNICIKRDELEKEHNTIIKISAKFAHFLQNNAITPFSDSYKGYIEYLIAREESLGEAAKMSVIDRLQKTLREYLEAKLSFDKALALQKKYDKTNVVITPQEIQQSIQILYGLKHTGKKIKELFECQKKSRTKEHKFKEYIHNLLPEFLKSKKKEKQSTNRNQINYCQQRDQPISPIYGELSPKAQRGHCSAENPQYQYQTDSRQLLPYGESSNCSKEAIDNKIMNYQQGDADQPQHRTENKAICPNEEACCSAEDPQCYSQVDSRQDCLRGESKDHLQDDPLLKLYQEGNPVN